jgi:hypothetical protein
MLNRNMENTNNQFERVKRLYKKFEEINNGVQHTQSSEFYKDTVYAFFQNFWMLKDHAFNSGEISKELIERSRCIDDRRIVHIEYSGLCLPEG